MTPREPYPAAQRRSANLPAGRCRALVPVTTRVVEDDGVVRYPYVKSDRGDVLLRPCTNPTGKHHRECGLHRRRSPR